MDGITQPAPAPRFSRTPGELTDPAPAPGEHTAEALSEWGLDDVAGLIDSGAAVAGEGTSSAIGDQRPVALQVRVVVERHQVRARRPADDLGDAAVDHQPGQRRASARRGSPSAWTHAAAMTPPEVTAIVPPGAAVRSRTAPTDRLTNASWLSA